MICQMYWKLLNCHLWFLLVCISLAGEWYYYYLNKKKKTLYDRFEDENGAAVNEVAKNIIYYDTVGEEGYVEILQMMHDL